MSSNKSVLVLTGASGFVGCNIIKYLSQDGWQIRALVRNPKKQAVIDNVKYYEYDLTKPLKNEAGIFKDADYLVHAAYVKFNRDNPSAFEDNIKGAKRLLEASRKYHLKKNLFLSTMSAHSKAESVYGKQKLTVEKLFITRHDVVIRPGLIIGNGGIVGQMSNLMKKLHIVPLVGGGKQPLQIVAVTDLVKVIVKLLAGSYSGMYTIATPEVYSYKDFYKQLAKQLDVKVLFILLPFWFLALALKIVELLHLPIGISNDNALGLKHLKSTDTAKDLESIKMTLLPLDEALQKIEALP